MNKFFAVTLAGLLLSSVSLSVAYAKDGGGEGEGEGGGKTKTDTFVVKAGKVGDTKASPDGVKILGVETFDELKPGAQYSFKTTFGGDGSLSVSTKASQSEPCRRAAAAKAKTTRPRRLRPT